MDNYELIPMDKITDEAIEIAVLWMECNDKNWIGQKHKLASDIMNYASKYHESEVKKLGLFGVVPCLFYVVERNAEETWEQISIAFDNYKDALEFKNTNYHKKTYPYSFIVTTLK